MAMTWWIFQHLATVIVVAAVVAAVCRLGRLGPVARHALWLVVLIKLVTPPVVAWPWTVPDPFGLTPVQAASDPGRGDSVAADAVPDTTELSTRDVDAESTAWVNPPATPNWTWLLGVWLVGSLGVLLVESVRLARLATRTAQASPAPDVLVDRVASHATRLGLATVPIVMVDGRHSPSVWGLFRPRLLWPTALPEDTPEAGIDGLIVHELAHVKRRDYLVGWLELVAGVAWWWNPLFWFVRSALREQAELACDAWVISALPNGRRAYAESLLALSGAGQSGATAPMAVVGARAGSRRALERRLVMIMQGRTSLRLPFLGLCCLALVGSATLPTWASSPQDPPPPPPTIPATTRPVVQEVPTPRLLVTPSTTLRQVPRQTTPQRIVTIPPTSETLLRQAIGGGRGRAATLPEEGQALLQTYNSDLEAIQREAAQKSEARRDTLTKELEQLQDTYTKAGKLDEAIAIRNYLRRSSGRSGVIGGVAVGVQGGTGGGIVGGSASGTGRGGRGSGGGGRSIR
jgi:beta-lactamase regulating signal transducer with metallopeptidase domain